MTDIPREPAPWGDRPEPEPRGCLPLIVAALIVIAIFAWLVA